MHGSKNNRAITIMPNVPTNASIHVHLVIIDMTLNYYFI